MSVSNTTLKERFDTKKALLDQLYINLTKLLEDNVDTYKLDTGTGSQMVKSRTIKNLQDGITKLEKELDQIAARLEGSGLVVTTFRRNGICNFD